MSIRTIDHPLPGERVIGLSPQNAVEATTTWLRRPNLFPGRALGAGALAQRQAWQAGRIAQRGQDWGAGIVDGLEVQSRTEGGTDFASVRLQISRGRGLTVGGEDVVLTQVLDCRLADVPVVAPPEFFETGTGVGPGTEADEIAEPFPRQVGVTPGTLIPVTLGTLVPAAQATLLPIGVLVLQPVALDIANLDRGDPCERSACDEGTVDDAAAFEDWRIADAVRLVWYVWPGECLALPPVEPQQLRNALAWKVFDAERRLAADAALPWEPWGVPLAIVALDSARVPLWLDRASVVRQGGRGRDPRLQITGGTLATRARLPALWQAQIEQFAEQVAAGGEPAPPAGDLGDAFTTRLPPIGLLPKSAFDPVTHRSDFFPARFDLDAAPIPVEQLDLAVRASAPLAPIDPNQSESVRILVPVPLQSWEPRLLLTETVDEEFKRTLDRFLLTRARTLGLRQGLRYKAAMLSHALNGGLQTIQSFRDDPLAVEPESLRPWGEPPPGGGHRSALLAGVHQHFFDGVSTPFVLAAGESLFAWVCLDPDNPPRTLMFQWHTNDANGWNHRAYWGDDLVPFGAGNTTPEHFRVGDLPTPGAWVMLAVRAEHVGLARGSLDGMAFTLYDGRAAYGLAGARSGPVWRKWFCNFLPAGARVQGNEGWDLLTANDLWAPFEPAGGVVPSLPQLIVNAGGGIFEGGSAGGNATLAVPTGGINVYYPPAEGWRGHVLFLNEAASPPPPAPPLPPLPPLPALTGADKLRCWMYLDELTPPRSIFGGVLCQGSPGSRSSIVYAFWGENRLAELGKVLPGLGSENASIRRAGSLPQSGTWTAVDLPLPALPEGATGLIPAAVFFMGFGGTLAFSDLVIQPATPADAPQVFAWPRTRPPPALRPVLNAKLALQSDLGVLAPTPSARIGTVRVYTELVNDPLVKKLSSHEQSQLLLRGLEGFTDYLRTRIDRADDITDFGFAHMQVDMHRVRQLMMSTSDASRLAVSPVLAAIAKSDSAIVVQAQIKEYLSSVKTSTRNAAPFARAGVSAAAGSVRGMASAATAANVEIQPARVAVAARLIRPPNAPLDIIYARPVIGLSEIRTTAIADRLKAPPSTESRDHALANRHRTVSSLRDLLRTFLAEDSGEVPAMLADFEVLGLANDPFLANAPGGKRTLAQFVDNNALLEMMLSPPPIAGAPDESVFFTQAISLSDTTIAMLRQLEGRLTVYRDALTRCEAALDELQRQATASTRRLQAVADELAEARHDVSVARALMAEETERVAAVNTRRARVLSDEVKFLAFVRPREVDNLVATPTHSIDPGLIDPPVPACLREHPDAPEELLDMLRVVREAPAKWFVRLPSIVRKLDKVEHLMRLVQSSQVRAMAGIAMPLLGLHAATAGKLGQSITRVVSRQAEALAPRIAAVRNLSLASLASATWQGVRVQAEQVVSFADLADGGHGRAEVSQAAAAELENIRSIVSCLHAEFSGISAAIRLDWAEMLSEFDAAPNLHDLSTLPRWGEIAYIDRRQMQAYADFLFGQVEPGQPQAVALVNDVVRMCLLLASHAPVDRIVAGRMARPLTGVSPGIRIPLAVADLSRLRVGMQALVYRGDSLVARATVEDLGASEVSARVIHTAAAQVDLGDDVRVHFDNAAMVSLKTAAARRTRFGG